MAPWERFEAFRACHQLALAVYRATKAFPPDERFGLTAQLRRAAFSAAANIGEGSARRGAKVFASHLDIAVGSLAEVAYAIRMAHDLGYLTEPAAAELRQLQGSAGRLTWLLYAAVRRKR